MTATKSAAKKTATKKTEAKKTTTKIVSAVVHEAELRKRTVDKRAVRRLKKIRRHATKLFQHLAGVGKGSKTAASARTNIRVRHAEDLLEVVEALLQEEKAGWLDL